MHPRHIALLLPIAALLGCGTNLYLPSTGPSTYLILNGPWVAIATQNLGNTVLSTPIADFTGALQSTNGTVTGTLRAFDPTLANPCVSPTQDLYATGTLTTSGNLSLTFPLSGGTATITATLGPDLHSYADGSWQIAGGACGMHATPIDIFQYAPITGTYTDTFYVMNNNVAVLSTETNITAILSQSSTPNADGLFPLTGTVTATGACAASLTIDDLVSGDHFSGSTPTSVLAGATLDTDATSLVTAFSAPPACNSQIFQGTLTRK
jgi:hypothetical protein